MHQRRDFDWDQVWREDMDRNGDGFIPFASIPPLTLRRRLDENELRTVIVVLHGSAFEPEDYEKQRYRWYNCTCAPDNCGFPPDGLVVGYQDEDHGTNNANEDGIKDTMKRSLDGGEPNSVMAQLRERLGTLRNATQTPNSHDVDILNVGVEPLEHGLTRKQQSRLAVAEKRDVTKHVVRECEVFDALEAQYRKKLKYKFEIEGMANEGEL